MGVAIIADIIVSAVVSKVAAKVITKVGKGLGMSDSGAGLLGSIAGIVAGSYSYGAASNAMNASTNAANAASSASQAGQLAEQTAEFGKVGESLTSGSLNYAGNAVNASIGATNTALSNNALMDGYAASPANQGVIGGAKDMATAAKFSPEAITTTAAKEAPWYETMWDDMAGGDKTITPDDADAGFWDSNMKSRTGAAFVQSGTGAVLQADAQKSQYERKRADQLEDVERKRWKKPISIERLPSFGSQRQYQYQYIKPNLRPLMQRG